MTRRLLKIVVAYLMLGLYITTMLASEIVVLTCGCNSPHSKSHATCTHCCHHHCASSSCEDVSQDLLCDGVAEAFDASHCCSHDHSTEVELYTQPRVDNDLRQNVVLALLMDVLVNIPSSEESLTLSYSEYRLPALLAGYIGANSLRAPPAMV